MRRRDKYLLAVVAIVVLLIGVRIALPPVIRNYVNGRLAALEEYDGSVADVDLALLRGGYRVKDMRIVKTGAQQPTPFFDCDAIEATIEWRSLLHGSLVAEGAFFRPRLNLVQGQTRQQSQLGTEVNWADRLKELFPFRFNTVRVHDGTITFRAPGIRTRDALVARNVNGEVSNLTNVVDSGQETFAHFGLAAAVLDGGSAKLDGSIDPLARAPTFDLNLALENVQLPQVNPWLSHYIKADAESGHFELFVELAAADGKFRGYAKPVMRDVNIYSAEEPERNPLRRLWEGLVDFAADVLENDEKEQVAARMPFSGTIQNPDADILATIGSVLRNAFVSAFARSLEGSISVRNVRQSLKEIGDADQQRGDNAGNKKKNDKKQRGKKPGNERAQGRTTAALIGARRSSAEPVYG